VDLPLPSCDLRLISRHVYELFVSVGYCCYLCDTDGTWVTIAKVGCVPATIRHYKIATMVDPRLNPFKHSHTDADVLMYSIGTVSFPLWLMPTSNRDLCVLPLYVIPEASSIQCSLDLCHNHTFAPSCLPSLGVSPTLQICITNGYGSLVTGSSPRCRCQSTCSDATPMSLDIFRLLQLLQVQ